MLHYFFLCTLSSKLHCIVPWQSITSFCLISLLLLLIVVILKDSIAALLWFNMLVKKGDSFFQYVSCFLGIVLVRLCFVVLTTCLYSFTICFLLSPQYCPLYRITVNCHWLNNSFTIFYSINYGDSLGRVILIVRTAPKDTVTCTYCTYPTHMMSLL